MDEQLASTETQETSHDADGLTRERVLESLKQVYDPENGDVDVTYSLTTMGCPIGPLIEDQIRAFLAPLPGIGEVRPELVFRPPWSPELMSDEAKAALGIF
jgi:metal-sulfur cluster biosynthetic enzyme